MTEYEINARRNWKAQTFPYDYYIPDETEECQYCLTEKQAEILRGIVEPLAWDTRWWSDTSDIIDRDAITAFRDDLVRRLMMSCCGNETPAIFRWTIDGELEMSIDGGLTFEPAPGFDPRNNSTQFPPLAGDDGSGKKCIAATGMVALIKEQVGDNLTDDMSRYTLDQLINDFVGTVINSGANIFQVLVTIAANQIFALIISVLRAALTETVYDTLKCIFFCAMEDDATFTEMGANEVKTQIGELIGGVASLFLQQLVFLLGSVGLTNLARSGAATEGDCSDCTDCPASCVPADWRTGLYYDGTWHDARGGTIIETGDDYIIIQSQDRGDGQSEVAINVRDRVTCCFVRWGWVGTVPDNALKWSTPCPASADLANWVRNDLMPTENCITSYYFQLDPGTWQMKFTFVPSDTCP